VEEKIFKLRGKTLAIIDWANVYGWFEKLKWEIDPKKLYDYLKSYPEIYDIKFYFGIEKGNKKSEAFHKEIKNIGYNLISKEVKWVPVDLKITHFKDNNRQIRSIAQAFGEKELYDLFEKFLKELHIPFGGQFYRRKCDFDCKITLDIMNNINELNGVILFSGDGDYAPLIEELIKRRKQTIVVFAPGCKGREFEDFKKGLYLCSVKKLKKYLTK
jgi:uncharacterized LabA/DUF88 family protein